MADYPKPSMTADAVVLAGNRDRMSLLAIERGNPPYQGVLALPGGFLDPYEQPLTACLRELEEETGLHLPLTSAIPLSLRTRKGRDPRGWTLCQPYLFHLPEPVGVRAGDDAARAFWQPLAGLETLAFDHGAMLCEALGRFWPAMPEFAAKLQGFAAFGQQGEAPRDAVFFGGSFNPWHEGHAACIELCPERENVIVVPDSNPFKTVTPEGCAWRFYRRLQDRVAAFGCPVFPGYCGIETPNPTVGWLPWTRYETKSFLMGDDSFASFPKWTDAVSLAKALTRLYVAPRTAPSAALEAARQWFSKSAPDCRIHDLPDHPYRRQASTELRQGSVEG